MLVQVKILLNTTLGRYSNDYRGTVRRIITGALDECVRKGLIPRHTLGGIELAPRIVTAVQYEQQNKGMVAVADEVVVMMSEGIAAQTTLRFYIHASANAEQRIGAMMGCACCAAPRAGWLSWRAGFR